MSSDVEYDSTGVERYNIPSFQFISGAKIPISVSYRRFNPSAPRTILIPTCFGGRINNTLNFTEGPFSSYHVVVAAMLGNGESSSPSNTDNWPVQEYRDVINAHYELLTKGLGIESLEAVVGFSMGGQQAYYWAISHPGFVKRAVVICGSARTSDHNFAFLEGPKAALINSSDYHDGKYRQMGIKAEKGVAAFSRVYCAWLYSQQFFREKLWKRISHAQTMSEFMDEIGANLYTSWDPADLLALLQMWQRGDISVFREDGDFQKALEDIKIPVLLMPGRTDQYFPPEDNEIEVKFLKQGKLATIESVWGHKAGAGTTKAEVEFMSSRIADFLS